MSFIEKAGDNRMKVTFDIECTPEEARSFFGLPDVQPMQERMMDEIEKKMQENVKAMDPETMAKTWMPIALQNMAELQKLFWENMNMHTGTTSSKK